MLNIKQRASLRCLSMNLTPSVTIGKAEVGENIIAEIDTALDCKELIKISILQNSDSNPRVLADDVANILNADVVSVIGRKIVLYRRSKKKGVTHREF